MKGIKFVWVALFAASLVASTGCKSDADAGAGEQASSGEETAVKQAKLAKPDALLFDRPAVTGYGALASLDSFKKMATDMMAKFQFLPASVVPAMVDDSIKGQFQVQSLEWLDSSLPIVMLVGDMREQEDAGLVCLPLASKALFEKSLPASAEKDQEGNQFKMVGPMGRASYMNILGDSHVVVSQVPSAFAKYKDLLAQDLAKVKPKKTMEIIIRGEGVRTLLRKELDAAKAELETSMDSPEVKAELEQAGLSKEQAMKMFAMIEEIRSLELNSHVTDGRLIVQADLSAQEGSTLGRVWNTPTKGDIRSLIGLIPEKAYFASAALGVTGGLLKELGFNQAELGGGAALIGTAFDGKISKETEAELEAAIKSAVEGYSDRPAVGFLYKTAASPLAFASLTLDPSAAESQKRLEKVFAVLWKGLAEVILADAGEMPPGVVVDPASFSKSFESMKGLAVPFGVTLSKTVKAGTNGVTVDGYRAKIAYEALPDYEMNKSEMDAIKGLVGDVFEVAMGSSKDRVGTAFGPAAVEDLNSFLTAGAGKVGPNDEARLKVGYENTSVFVRIDAIQLLQNIQSGAPEGLLPPGTNLPAGASQGGLVVMLGNSKANTSGMVLDIPLGDIAALVRAFNLSPM